MQGRLKNIDSLTPKLPISHSSMEQGLFKSRDGTSIYYEVEGEGSPLVLCYGLTCRIEHWHYQREYFAKRYRVICLDYRGHHRSCSPQNKKHLTVQWCANDVVDLIRYLGLTQVACFGHSLGVPIAAFVAHELPEIVKATVLVCGTVRNPLDHMFYSNKLQPVFRLMSQMFRFAPDAMSRLWHQFTHPNGISYFLTSRFGFNPELSSEKDVRMYLQGVHQAPFEVFFHLLNDYASFDGRTVLSSLKCPTLILTGERDFITPMYLQEEMVRLIPLGEFDGIPNGSHNVHMDFPSRVNRKIEHFLSRNQYR